MGFLRSLLPLALAAAALGGDPAGALERANAAFQRKDFREAVRLYNEALRADPRESTYYLRASAREGARDYEGAVDDYKQVLVTAAAEANSTYARKTRRRLQDLCVSTCGTYCLKVLPRDALTKETTEECRGLSRKAKGAASLPADELAALAKRCPHNLPVLKASLRQASRDNAYKEARGVLERLKGFSAAQAAAGSSALGGSASSAGSSSSTASGASAALPSPAELHQLSDVYDYLSLIEAGDLRGLSAKVKRAVASDPEDAMAGAAMKLVKALTQGQAMFQNATVASALPAKDLASFPSLVSRGLDGADRFVGRAEERAAAVLRQLYPELRRYESAKAVANFGRAADQIRSTLRIMECVAGMYGGDAGAQGSCAEMLDGAQEGSAKEGPAGRGEGQAPSPSEYKANALNSYYIALYHALRANGCVKRVQAMQRKGEDIEDELATCEKAVNRALAVLREAQQGQQGQQAGAEKKADGPKTSLEKDINRLSDRIFEYQKALLVPDFYKILGVTRSTPLNEIRKNYYRLAKEYHPDYTPANATEEEKKVRERKFQRIAEAWDVLSDPEKKKQYDSGMYMQEELAQREAAHRQAKAGAQQTQQAQQIPFQQFNFGGNGGGYRKIIFQQGGNGANGGNFEFFNNDFFRQFRFM